MLFGSQASRISYSLKPFFSFSSSF
ncbi:hypothetical protein EMIT0111MI5_60184 [Burkholderia sp. IT-111MI5]